MTGTVASKLSRATYSSECASCPGTREQPNRPRANERRCVVGIILVAYNDYGDMVAESCSRSEEHTSELQSLMRISYAVFCLKKNTILPALHISQSSMNSGT